MNLGITNFKCSTYNANPSFGMAIKLDKSAHSVIKQQALKLGNKSRERFFAGIEEAVNKQQDNPVNIILRKSKTRNALAAEVSDSESGRELGAATNFVTSQPFFFKNGSLKFLKAAQAKADDLNSINSKLDNLIENIPAAEATDYGKIIK